MAQDRTPVIATFSFNSETKNTVQFIEDQKPGTPPVFGKLYVSKEQLKVWGDPRILKAEVSPA